MGQFLPGTDFVTSGYSAIPRYDNMFGGGNYDSDDLDEWLTIQRDWQVDAGIEPLDEATRAQRCASAPRGRSRRCSPPSAFRRSATRRSRSRRRASTRATCPTGPRRRRRGGGPRARRGDRRARRRAGARRGRFRRRRRSDLRHAAPARRRRLSPDVGDHRRGRSGRVGGQRRRTTIRAGHGLSAVAARAGTGCNACPMPSTRGCSERARGHAAAEVVGEAAAGDTADDVVIAVGPAFGTALLETIGGLPHGDVLEALIDGVREEGARRGSSGSGVRPMSPRSATTAPCCRVGDRGGRPVERHRADPPRGPRAARLPRAVRDGSLADPRVVPPDRRATRPATHSGGRSLPSRRRSTTSRARS